jgi:hypothetical protein
VLPTTLEALGFTASWRAAGRLVALVLLVVALAASLPGTGVLGWSSASASTETTVVLHASEASQCAHQRRLRSARIAHGHRIPMCGGHRDGLHDLRAPLPVSPGPDVSSR